ncbi:gamma-butyrobetaine dioxygenase [Leptidea sinapis]|uniref:gamma-butyrobetaine dioxygenase n=1 Tax=Leptidea sinapis TaxID=189913 RepID=UPI0021C413EC|nr:gamma-butyrobetaine dioxygenase [Leptidea sinapis]
MFTSRTFKINEICKYLLNAKVKRCYPKHILSNRSVHDVIHVDINGVKLIFPNVWLRDNCQCEQCFHVTAKSRIIDYNNFNVDTKPVKVTKNSNSLQVTWDDGHTSKYGFNWLKLRSFSPKYQKKYNDDIYRSPKIVWHGKDFYEICKKHDYKDIISSDEALHKWLNDTSVYGVSVIEKTPNSETAIDEIVKRVGFTKRTHYGEKFVVQNVTNTSNVAYLSSSLQIHTDLPYYEYCPGVNMLHFLVQTKGEGGENILSDGHYTAKYIKDNFPEDFKLLTNVQVEWSDVGEEAGNEFYKLYRAPIIEIDSNDEINRINFSIPQRGSHFPGSIEDVVPWYKALKLFFNFNKKFAAKFKTPEGNILVFDNIRLLHGRNKYEDSENNVRKLIGAYIDWDEIYSRLRCVKVKLNLID